MGFQWSLADRSIGGGFRRIAREQIGRAIGAAEDSAAPPPRRVHEARRRAKKLRALLRLVRPDFGHYAEENAVLRDTARGLSATRDVEVAEDTLAQLMQWAGREAPLGRAIAPRNDAETGLAEFAAEMRRMLERTSRWKTRKIDLDTLARGLTDTYRRGLEAMQLTAGKPTDTAFHEWRKQAKYHWNQLGLLEAAAENILPSAHKAAGELADLLGLHHDLAVLRGRVDEAAGEFGELDGGFVRAAAKRRQAELETKIGALGRQVYAETPEAFHARFRSYLEGWAAQEAAG